LITGGCDQESARQNQGQANFEKVLKLLHDTEIGYVIANEDEVKGSSGNRESTGLYRQKQLNAAFVALDPIIKEGTDNQKIDAYRLAADIYTSSARYQTRQMMDQWTTVSTRSVVMMSYLVAVGRSQSLAKNKFIDDGKLIAQIKKTLRDTTVDLEKNEKQADKVNEEIKTHKKNMDDLQKQIDTLNTQSQQIKSKAFVAKGPGKYKLLDDASAVARQAAILDARRQVEEAQLANLNSRRTMMTEQIDFTLEFMDSLERQIEEATQRQKANEDQHAKAADDLTNREQKFIDEFNKITASFSDDIVSKFKDIDGEITRSLDMLSKARALASGTEQQLIDIELLVKQVSALDMQSSMIMVLHDMGDKYQQVLKCASEGKYPVMADRRTTFQSSYEVIQRKQLELIQKADELTSQARQQAATALTLVSEQGSLTRMAQNARSTETDALAKATENLNGLIDTYVKRISDSKLN
jgi:predicted  nucleic acid-binding Zn-ribbon protein